MNEETPCYSIGDIVWAVIPSEKSKEKEVYPLQVCEEVTKKTLEGVETIFYVKNNKKVFSVVDLSSEGISLWASLSSVEEYLQKQFNDSLQVKINKATNLSKSWFGIDQHIDDDEHA